MIDNTFTAYEVIVIARYLGIEPKKVQAVGWLAAMKRKSVITK